MQVLILSSQQRQQSTLDSCLLTLPGSEWPMAAGRPMAASFPLTLVDVFHQVAVLLGVSPNDLILLVNDNAHLLQTF